MTEMLIEVRDTGGAHYFVVAALLCVVFLVGGLFLAWRERKKK